MTERDNLSSVTSRNSKKFNNYIDKKSTINNNLIEQETEKNCIVQLKTIQKSSNGSKNNYKKNDIKIYKSEKNKGNPCENYNKESNNEKSSKKKNPLTVI